MITAVGKLVLAQPGDDVLFLGPLVELVARPMRPSTSAAGSPAGTMPLRFKANRNASSCSSACAAGAADTASAIATGIADSAASTRRELWSPMAPPCPAATAAAGVSHYSIRRSWIKSAPGG